MALNFTNVGEKWVAEFSVTDDFNLHIEREESGYLIVNQRTTAEGKYDSIRDGSFNYGDPVVDIDFTGVIYPKYIQVISKVEPTYAEVTSHGEVEQIGGVKKVSIESGGEVREFEYEDGMTWGEWAKSEYSLGFFYCDSVYVLFNGDGRNVVSSKSGRYMECNDVIDNNDTFYLGGGGE